MKDVEINEINQKKELLENWLEISSQLKELKVKEKEIRDTLINSLFGNVETLDFGTHKDAFFGLELNIPKKSSFTVTNSEVESLMKDGTLPSNLVRTKFELDQVVYNKLPDLIKDDLVDVIETKQGSPSLKLKSL